MSTLDRETARSPHDRAQDAGAESNTRLTSATGLVLLVMFAVEGYTILDVQGLITLHIFLGVMLVGPVLLKSATTMYRVVRYYQGKPAYVRRGPPHIVLRVLGPLVMLSSLTVLGTGIALLFVPAQDSDTVLTAHQASFIVWVSLMTIHVLGHIREAAVTSWRDARHSSPRRAPRLTALVLALAVGTGGALLLLPHAGQWTNHELGHHRRYRP